MKATAFDRLAASVASLRNAAEVETFLDELLTPAEIHDLALRWQLLELLGQGVPQREIAHRLGISLCKITRGSRILKNPGSVARRFVVSRS